MYCRQCGKPLREGEDNCPSCHAKIGKGNRYCYQCGEKDNHSGDFCESCGAKLTISASELLVLQQKSKPQTRVEKADVPIQHTDRNPTMKKSVQTLNQPSETESEINPAIQKLMATGKRSDVKVSMYSNYGGEDNPLSSGKDDTFENYFNPRKSNNAAKESTAVEQKNSEPKKTVNTAVISDRIANAVKKEDDIADTPTDFEQLQQGEENSIDFNNNKPRFAYKGDFSLFGIAAMLLSMGFVITNSIVFLITGFVASVVAIMFKDMKLSAATIIMLAVTAINTFVMPLFF